MIRSANDFDIALLIYFKDSKRYKNLNGLVYFRTLKYKNIDYDETLSIKNVT